MDGKKGSMAINQTMILVLAVVVLVIIAAFYLLLGDKASGLISNILTVPGLEGE